MSEPHAQRFASVTTTVATRDEASAMARSLVASRLAACVQILPIDSVYRWNDAIEAAAEWMLVAKIRTLDYPDVEAAIVRLHGYAIPEIIMSGIEAGFSPYLDWIAETTQRPI